MAESTARGSFVWQELMTSDVSAAVAYYQKVVGWKTQPHDDNYLMWVAKSGPIGGVAELPAGQTASYWLPYIGVPDIAATVQQAQKLGGSVVTPVTALSSTASYAVLSDPQGAIFGVYGSSSHSPTPPAAPNQLGQFTWQELATSDYKAAFAFYQALFGWEKTGEHDMGDMGVYFMFGRNGEPFGGMFNKPSAMPIGWCGYVQVDDARKIAKVAAKAGATVLNGPMQVPGGAWIVQIADPQGTLHAVLSSEPMPMTKPEASAATTVKPKQVAKTQTQTKPAKTAKKKAKKAAKSVSKSTKKSAKKAAKNVSKAVKSKSAKNTAGRKPAAKRRVAGKKVSAKKSKRSAPRRAAKQKRAGKKKSAKKK